jgi:hypothetical protein
MAILWKILLTAFSCSFLLKISLHYSLDLSLANFNFWNFFSFKIDIKKFLMFYRGSEVGRRLTIKKNCNVAFRFAFFFWILCSLYGIIDICIAINGLTHD